LVDDRLGNGFCNTKLHVMHCAPRKITYHVGKEMKLYAARPTARAKRNHIDSVTFSPRTETSESQPNFPCISTDNSNDFDANLMAWDENYNLMKMQFDYFSEMLVYLPALKVVKSYKLVHFIVKISDSAYGILHVKHFSEKPRPCFFYFIRHSKLDPCDRSSASPCVL
jgi:hypothetical protein